MKEFLIDYSKGNELNNFWRFYRKRETSSGVLRSLYTFLMCRSATKHGGYVGPGARLSDIPSLPHGLHGVYISRYASIGKNCRIYQNVSIGEVDGQAPCIGNNCLIGAGAVLVGGIRIGDNVKIGAGAVVSEDIPDNCTVVSVKPRVIGRSLQDDRRNLP